MITKYKNPDIYKLAEDVSKETGISVEDIIYMYSFYFGKIREEIASLDMNNEAENAFTSFNLVNLGKLYTTGDRIKFINKKRSESNKYKKD